MRKVFSSYPSELGRICGLTQQTGTGQNGGNFGWDDREGSFRFESNNTEGLIDPVAEYDHFNVVSDPPTNIGNRAVTVGEVARGTGIPGLDGLLPLSDFPTGMAPGDEIALTIVITMLFVACLAG